MDSGKSALPNFVITTSAISLLCLLLLHFLSPEFEPNWRMVSEYALGEYKWLVSLFFIFWGFSSILLAAALWSHATTKVSAAGVVLLFVSGVGAALAALFDVTHTTGHGFAGLLGIPTVPAATLIISYHLSKKQEWEPFSKPIKLLAHFSWIALLLMIVAMVIMMTGFQNAGIEVGPDAQPPSHVPEGVIAIAGYVNRLLIVVDILWLIVVARSLRKIYTPNFQFAKQ
jgi:hypothetical membrane protein